MRTLIFGVILAMSVAAHGQVVVADYGAEFQTPTPATGWSYLWNANGPIGTASNYVPLVFDSTDSTGGYQSVNDGAYPDADPGAFVRASGTEVAPGQTSTQGSNTVQRYVIMAYTFSAADVSVNGSSLLFHTYNFNIPSTVPGLIDVLVLVNDTPVFGTPFPPDTVFSDALYGQDYPFGTVSAGDTLYIGLGANGDYQGDPLGVAYTLALTPEPSSMLLLLPGSLLLMRRRQRR